MKANIFTVMLVVLVNVASLDASNLAKAALVAVPPEPPEMQLLPPVSELGGLFPTFADCGGALVPAVNVGYEQRVVELVNLERASHSLPPLKRVTPLEDAARYHAADMLQDDYFDHDSFDRAGGSLVWVCSWTARINAYYTSWQQAAENIAAGYSTPEAVVNAWLSSPGHRANIINALNREIGVGYYQGGKYSHYWVQDFGLRSSVYPLVINREAAATSSTSVSLYVYGDWEQIRLRNDDDAWSEWQPFQNELGWTLSARRGERVVWAEMKKGAQTAASSDSIYLDIVTPPVSVSVSGPASGRVGEPQAFTATFEPENAPTPITYVWQAEGQPPVTHVGGLSDTVTFTWSAPGAYAITVTAASEWGTAVDAHTLVLQAAPLAGVNIYGPTTGYLNTFYSFESVVEPVDASTPVTFTWRATGQTPITHLGGLSDTVTLAWGVTGAQVVSVTVSNVGGGSVTAVHVITLTAAPCVDVGPAITSARVLSYTDGAGSVTAVEIPTQAQALTLCYIPLTQTWPAPGGRAFAHHAFRLEAYVGGSLSPTLILVEPATVTLHYSDADVRGIARDTLALYHWAGAWAEALAMCREPGSLPAAGENWLRTSICRAGELALFGKQYRLYLPVVMKNR